MDATTKSLRIHHPSSIPISFIFLFLFFFAFSQSQPIPTAAPTNPPKPSQSSLKIAVSLSIASGVLILILIIVMGCFVIRRFRSGLRKGSDFESDETKSVESGSVRRFSWEEIETMTTSFARVIGSGGFSTVYLGRFSGTGGSGAVKIHTGSERLNRLFKQELDILLRLQHKNIVKLLGYCDDREEGALVFEYVPNGNLQERLHGTRDCPKIKLPWRTRMSIALQLARAIEYLHEQCSLQIVHGDIKSSNILLDEGLNVKLCDFGFAKMGFSSTITPPSMKTKNLMIGSPGYTDPHYIRTGIASKKNDVYSFGVVVLELVTGLEAFCAEKGELLTSVVVPKLSSLEETTILEMVDPNLGGEFDIEEAKVMLEVSCQCLGQAHTLRPSATQMLEMIGEKVNSVDLLMSSPEKDSKLGLSLLN